jgi:hypothetical protein
MSLGSADKQNQNEPWWHPKSPPQLATQQDLERLEIELMTVETNLDAQIADLTTSVQNETTVSASALTLIQGIPALIAAAIASATAAGATPTQLQAISDLQTTLDANDTTLAAAVTAGTPAASGSGVVSASVPDLTVPRIASAPFTGGSGPSPSPSISAQVAAKKSNS